MERRKFLQCAHLCGAGLLGLGTAASAQAGADGPLPKTPKPLTLRPYQLLCAVCSLGEEGSNSAQQYAKCREIRDAVRNNPDMPITLACHAGALYAYQDSGTKEDTPESEEFNRKRDLDVLQILGLAPGCTLPARAIFKTLLMGVSTVSGICGYQVVTGEAWKGCPKAASGNYERGYEKGIQRPSVPPPRTRRGNGAREEEIAGSALFRQRRARTAAHSRLCGMPVRRRTAAALQRGQSAGTDRTDPQPQPRHPDQNGRRRRLDDVPLVPAAIPSSIAAPTSGAPVNSTARNAT